MYQTVLVIGSFMLFSILTLTINSAIIDKIDATYQSESIIAATTLGQALLQEINLQAFDQTTTAGTVDTVSLLTAVNKLGKDGFETYATFNDIDDYNNFSRKDTITNGIFTSSVRVQYVSAAAPGDTSVQRVVDLDVVDGAEGGPVDDQLIVDEFGDKGARSIDRDAALHLDRDGGQALDGTLCGGRCGLCLDRAGVGADVGKRHRF